jgi:type VI secretion system protein ImpJ
MQNRHRVVWAQGMFLTPQHFQTMEQYFEAALQFRFAASHYANWGVIQLDIDADALANGKVLLHTCRGIMPDGEPVNIPDSDAAPPSRALADSFTPNLEALDVYLSLPDNRPRARNVTIPGQPQSPLPAGPPGTRYLAETLMITDENLGDDEKPVQVARGTFRLTFGNEYRDGFSSLHVARLTRSAAGRTILDPAFVAPCLDLASSRYLSMLLSRQIEVLASKSTSLAAPRRQRGKVLAEFSASETTQFWLLHTVNSFLPEMKHIWKVRHGHPELAYVAMLRLAGALATFSLDGHPENLPDYDHEELGRCFSLLDERIRVLLNAVLPERYISIPLDLSDRFLWSGVVKEDQYFKNSQFFLAVSAKMGVDDLIRKVPQLVKISSSDEVQRLVRNSLPGLTLRHTSTPSESIPMRLENQYFLLNQVGGLWEAIVRSRQIAVFAPGEIVEPKMEVLVVLE